MVTEVGREKREVLAEDGPPGELSEVDEAEYTDIRLPAAVAELYAISFPVPINNQ